MRTAIVYDFDGTLARGNIQEHTFLPDMGIPKEKFWADVQDEAKSTDSDQILVYMRRMLEAAKDSGEPLKRLALREHGRSLPLFEGVSGWFDRINDHASEIGLAVEHYVISSGIHEMIEGCEIAESFWRFPRNLYQCYESPCGPLGPGGRDEEEAARAGADCWTSS